MRRIDISNKIALAANQNIKEREYWLKKLAGNLTKANFRCDKIRTGANQRTIHTETFKLEGELFFNLMKVAKDSDIKLHIVAVTGIVVLLSRYSDIKDIVVGMPVYKQEFDGELVNSILALRNQVRDDMTFREMLVQVGQTIFEAAENQNYPIEALLEKLNIPAAEDGFPLFDIAILLKNIHEKHYLKHISLGMVFSFFREDNYLECIIEYNPHVYEKTEVRRIVNHFTCLLSNVLPDVNIKLSQIEFLAEEEKKQILFEFNNKKADFPRDKTIVHFIEKYADTTPRCTALSFNGVEVTYRELNERADRLAWELRAKGIQRDRLAGILLNRSDSMVESITAVWKAGGAYIPISPDDPAERIVNILTDSGADVLVTRSDYVSPGLENVYNGHIVKLDKLPRMVDESEYLSREYRDLPMDMNSLAYVIYTSGSTGKPKGAMVEHIGMMNHIQNKIDDLRITRESIVAQNASHTFDISVWQFFVALVEGGKTIIYPNRLILDPGKFIARLIKDEVTILEVVPSYLAVMLETLDGMATAPLLLHYLLVTGEEVKAPLVIKWFEKYPHVKLVNAYGPTEASDDITHHIMDASPAGERIPIGSPLRNLNIYIVDEYMHLCPVGIIGEICVSGVGVGRGYLKDEERTKQVFMEDPFSEKGGVRLYKTGDLGRWLHDGTIEFFGRKDYQVKIRGFRIELGEIESRLITHPGIKETVVMDREDEHGNKYLCAYFVSHRLDTSGKTPPAAAELKEYLSGCLPDYMIPGHFVQLEELPLTPNGKVDRKALPDPFPNNPPGIPYFTGEMLNEAAILRKKKFQILSRDTEATFLKTINNLIENEKAVLQAYSMQKGDDFYPLSHPQKMIYYTEKRYAGTSCQNEIFTIKYSQILDRELLEKAINIILSKFDGIRLRIVEIDHNSSIEPAQYISPYKEIKLNYFDFSGADEEQALKQWLNENDMKPFRMIDSDLFYFAYLKFNSSESGYYMNFHHTVSDGWTTYLLAVEIDKIYHALRKGETVIDEPAPSYIQYVSDEKDYLQSPQVLADIRFWQETLLPLPDEVHLSAAFNNSDSIKGCVCVLPFPDALRAKIHQYRQLNKTSIYKLIFAALAVYISRVRGSRDFVIGALNHNRSTERDKNTAGVFIRFIPIRVTLDPHHDFLGFVKDTGEYINNILRNHQRFPFDVLINELREKTGIEPGYFYNVNLVGHPDLVGRDFTLEHRFPGYEATPLSIHINMSNRDVEGILELEWDYQVGLFSETDVRQIHRSLVNLLDDALGDPKKKLSEIEILSPEEKKQILYEFSGRVVSYPGDQVDKQSFEEPHYYYILNREGKPQPIGIPGRLCLRKDGAGIEKGGGMYETGKLARWMADGSIEFLGYIRETTFRGEKVNLGKIETLLKEYEGIDDAVVIARKNKFGKEDLWAFIIFKGVFNFPQLKEYLAGKIASSIMPVHFARLEKMPFTDWGDVDRKLLEFIDLDMDEEDDNNMPSSPLEKKLAEIWSEVLGLDEISIGVHTNFFALGGHSLKAIILAGKIHKVFNVRITVAEIFNAATLKSMAKCIKDAVNNRFVSIGVAEKREYYPLSSAQKRLYVLQQMETSGVVYNMPQLVEIRAEVDKEALERIFYRLIQRHESLRTSFPLIDGEPVQKIHDNPPFQIKYREESAEVGVGEIIANSVKAFNLSQAPLLRVELIKIKVEKHMLFIDMHHIISDGVSNGILVNDFMALAAGKELSTLKLQYKDFSQWQNSRDRVEEIRKQEEYWLNRFEGEIPVLEMPTDYKRTAVRRFEGSSHDFKLNRELTGLLIDIADSEGMTLFMVLLTVFNIFLTELSGQEDIVVGTPIVGRNHDDLNRIIGLFVNTLALRNLPFGDKTFTEFLREVKVRTLEAFENQDYLFEDLVSKVAVDRDTGRNPLFDVMFVFQTIDSDMDEAPTEGEAESKTVVPGNLHNISKFDLTLMAKVVSGELTLTFEYCTKLFRENSVERFAGYLNRIAAAVVREPGIKLAEIEIISPGEKEQLLVDFNHDGVATDFPKDKTIHQLFEAQAVRLPDGTAVVGGTFVDDGTPGSSMHITYRELNERAERLATLLGLKGTGPECIVPVMIERSIEMIIAMLGILKAGGAYLPIDPQYPGKRIDYILEDSSAALLLTSVGAADAVRRNIEMLYLEDEIVYMDRGENLDDATLAENLAYIIYTSGSTGKPKGVMIRHTGIANLITFHSECFKVNKFDRIIQFASSSFDASVWETWMALLNGAGLYIVNNTTIGDYHKFAEYLNGNGITVATLPPYYAGNLEPGKLKYLRLLITAGSAPPPGLVEKWRKPTEYFNAYGPTEVTVCASAWNSRNEAEENHVIPIGKPINNTYIYILREDLAVQPVGLSGELCIAGVGLARGYLNRPELTAERFVVNPFMEGERLYRTGDHARWLPGGNIEFLGRSDYQVKVRGYRIELEEIENKLSSHDDIKEAAVIDAEDGGDKALYAYIVPQKYVSESSLDSLRLREWLGATLPHYMIPSYFVRLEEMPLTIAGKVDRKALPKPSNSRSVRAYNAPGGDIEIKLATVFQEVLGLEKVGVNDNFFEIGGDSIKAIQIASRLLKFRLKLEIKDLFVNPEITQLAKCIKPLERVISQEPVAGDVALTPIYHWFFENNFTGSHHFNQAVMLFRADGFDGESVSKVFTRIVEHHDALRIVFKKEEDGRIGLRNRGIDGVLFDLEIVNVGTDENIEEKIKTAATIIQGSINLSEGPLVKLGLFKTNRGDHLLIVIHHLAVDGVSWRIALEDFSLGYGQTLRGESIRFQDKTDSFKYWAERLVEYANKTTDSREELNEWRYWRAVEENGVQSLPRDFEIAALERKKRHNDSFLISLDEEYSAKLLKNVNHAYNTEINDILLVALGLAFREWGGINRLVVNLEAHGREPIIKNVDISRTVGWFTTQFPVSLDMSSSSNISYIIKSVKETLRRIPNKGIGYGILRYLAPDDRKKGIVFAIQPEVSFNYLGQFGQESSAGGDSIFSVSPLDSGEAICPDLEDNAVITVTGMITGDRLNISFTYNKKEFKRSNIGRLAESYCANLREIIRHCAQKEARERTPSDFGCSRISLEELDAIINHAKNVARENTEIISIYPLTPMQSGMFYHALSSGNPAAYFEQSDYIVYGDIDKTLLEKSFNRLIERYDVFRTIFIYDKLEEPLQIVLKDRKTLIFYEDISHLTGAETDLYLDNFKRRDREKGFDLPGDILMRLALFKVDKSTYRMVWSSHHILMDGWCSAIIYKELVQLYQAMRQGRTIQLTPVTPYKVYIDWMEKQGKNAAMAYWQKYLEGYEETTGLPQTRKTAHDVKYKLGNHDLLLDEVSTSRLTTIAEKNNATLYTVLQTVWGILLQKYNNCNDAVFGTVVSGRPPEIVGIEDMIGLFINTIPVRVKTEKNMNFIQLLTNTQEKTLLAKSYEYLPLVTIQSFSSLKDKLLNNLLVFENYPIDEAMKEMAREGDIGFRVEQLNTYAETNYDLNINFNPGSRLLIKFKFNSLVYSNDFIGKVAQNLKDMLTQVVENPRIEIQDIKIISDNWKENMLVQLSDDLEAE